MRIFAALGPGDIVNAHRRQIAGQLVETETSITYSGQFLEFCKAQNIDTLAISHNPRADALTDGRIRVENRPMFLENSGGLIFHISRVLRALYLAYCAKRFGADYALINSGSAHYFGLGAFALLRIPVAIDFHNTLWPNGYPEASGAKKLVGILDGFFFRWICAGAIGVAEECGRQMRQLAKRPVLFFDYRCQFRAAEFSKTSRAPMEDGTLRITFAGRVEENKGALDLIAIAEGLRGRPVKIDICGDGPALAELQTQIRDRDLGGIVTTHGALKRAELLAIYQKSDAVIVPTRSDFAEGMPKTCAEAALCGLPIITSRLSNALDAIGPAIIEAAPDDPGSYAKAIRALLDNPSAALKMKADTGQFLDRNNSLPPALDRLLSQTLSGWKPLDSYERIFGAL